MDDSYLTIENESVEEIKVKGSKFIARTFLAYSVEHALDCLQTVRKKEYSATHNCYAYLIGVNPKQQQFKYSDDGEPNGTAGRPIYDVISGSGATNLLVIVTRYFGGTKLGTGGLVKAYSESAKLAVTSSGIKENFLTDKYRVEIEFSLYDRINLIVNKIGTKVVGSDFSDSVTLTLEIRKSLSSRLCEDITELSSGKAKIEKV